MGRRIAQRLEALLREEGYEVMTFLTRPHDLSPKQIDTSAATVISIGGDGTLRSVTNLLLAASDAPPPLLVVPMGTANLMFRHLGGQLPDEFRESGILPTLKRREIVLLDAARANGELLLLMAGVGIDAQIVHEMDRVRTGPINYASYVLPTVLKLPTYDFSPITVVVDDRTVFEDRPAIAFIGNIKEYGTGFPILTEARSDDGLLDVCVLPCRDYRDLATILLRVAAGEHGELEDVIYTRGKSIRVDSAASVPVQIDGDSAGHTPLQIEILPKKIPFLVPA